MLFCQYKALIDHRPGTKLFARFGFPVAQYVKRWPSDLVVSGSRLASGGYLSNSKQNSIAYSLLISHSY